MKKIIPVLLVIMLLTLTGCRPTPAEKAALGALPSEPAAIETTGLAQAFIDAADYTLRDYVNREDVSKPIEYISWNTSGVSILTEAERKDIGEFMSGYGLPFDTNGLNSGRSIEQMQKGVELETVYNPENNYAAAEFDLIIKIRIFKGSTGRGYFAYFNSYRDGYVLAEIRAWESYPNRA